LACGLATQIIGGKMDAKLKVKLNKDKSIAKASDPNHLTIRSMGEAVKN